MLGAQEETDASSAPVFFTLLYFSLGGYRLCRLSDSLLVCQVIVSDRFEIRIEFVDQRDTGGNIEFGNFLVGDIIQVFDHGPQAVAMRGNQQGLPRPDDRCNGGMPEWQNTLQSDFQRLCSR